MLKEIINELRKKPCKPGTHRKDGKCVRLTTAQKKARKLSLKKSIKQRLKDKIKRNKLSCKDGYIKYKKNGRYKCIKKKDCPDGKSFSTAKNKCLKTFKIK